MTSLMLWEWISLKVVGHTMVSCNKRMNVEENVPIIPLLIKWKEGSYRKTIENWI